MIYENDLRVTSPRSLWLGCSMPARTWNGHDYFIIRGDHFDRYASNWSITGGAIVGELTKIRGGRRGGGGGAQSRFTRESGKEIYRYWNKQGRREWMSYGPVRDSLDRDRSCGRRRWNDAAGTYVPCNRGGHLVLKRSTIRGPSNGVILIRCLWRHGAGVRSTSAPHVTASPLPGNSPGILPRVLSVPITPSPPRSLPLRGPRLSYRGWSGGRGLVGSGRRESAPPTSRRSPRGSWYLTLSPPPSLLSALLHCKRMNGNSGVRSERIQVVRETKHRP